MRYLRSQLGIGTLLLLAFLIAYFVYDYVTNKDQPQLQYPAVVNLGDCEYGQFQTAIIPIENTGSQTVKLFNFRTSCGCGRVQEHDSDTRRPIESLELAPYARKTVSVRFMAAGEAGISQALKLHFQSSVPMQPHNAVNIIINSVTGGITTSPTTVSLGKKQVGITLTEDIDILDHSAKSRKLLNVVSNTPHVRVIILNNDRSTLPTGIMAKVQVQITVPEAGYFRSILQIQCTETETPTALLVEGEFANYIIVTPSSIILPQGGLKNTVYTTAVSLKTLSNNPFTIEDMKMPSEFKVEYFDISNISKKLQVTLLEKHRLMMPDGLHTCRISVKEGGKRYTIDIPVVFSRY